MKYSIDTAEGELSGELLPCDSRGQYSHPLARAILRNVPVITVTVEGVAKFHYLRLRGESYEVGFNLSASAQNNLAMIQERIEQSQKWLSGEMTRLRELHESIQVLKAADMKGWAE